MKGDVTMLTVEELAALPLYERAYYGLHGVLPDGRRVMRAWQRPEEAVIEYVGTLREALVATLSWDDLLANGFLPVALRGQLETALEADKS